MNILIKARAPLADRLAERIRARVDEALAARPAPVPRRVIRVRTRARAAKAKDAHAIVPLPVPHLARLVAALEAAGAAVIQLAWTAPGPLPPRLEAAVFAILEARRGRPSTVLLAPSAEPPGPPSCTVTRA